MRTAHLAPLGLLLALPAAAAALAVDGALEPLLKERDQEKLGETVGDYWTALTEESGINEAFAEVDEEVAKLTKKHRKKLGDQSFLKATADWQEVFFHANDYDDRGVKKGKQTDLVLEDPNFGKYDYTIHVPKSYSAKKGPWPVLLCIPDKDEKGSQHLTEDWIEAAGLDGTILVSFDMPTNERMWTEMGTADNHGGIDTVMLVLKAVKTDYAIDVDRTYLAGFGLGVPTAARVAALFPHVFAGVVGRAGDLDDFAPTNFRNVPTFFAGGGENCAAFAEAAKNQGFENVTLSSTGTEADVWGWLAGIERDPNPSEVLFSPVDARSLQCYWLGVDRVDFGGEPRIRAVVDRESNTITITATGISQARVSFNDALVDMDRPVRVVCNGTVQEDFHPRNLKTMLDNAYFSGDSGRVYTARHPYDVPAAASDEEGGDAEGGE